MDVLLLMSNFRLYSRLTMLFKHNSVRKNLFLSACFSWDSRNSLSEMDQKIKFGGTIGYGDSYLDSVFRYSKVFRLHAILHDTAGAVRLQTRILLHDSSRSKLLFAWSRDWTTILSLRKSLSTIHFQFIRFLNQYVFDCIRYRANWETEKKVVKELGLFIDGSVQGFSFCPPNTFKPNKQTTWNTNNLHGIAWHRARFW